MVANKRHQVPETSTIFPQTYFPNYSIHFHSTECAILYHNSLSVTPLSNPTQYLTSTHKNNFHVCGIILHTQTTDYAIYSVYRPQKARVTQLFKYPFDSDHIIIGGDFNIHHPVWGSEKACKSGSDFLNTLTASNLNLINHPTPTRIDPRNKTQTCIDLTLTSRNISNVKWRVDYNLYDPSFSDHYHIFINVLCTTPMRQHLSFNIGTFLQRQMVKFQKSLSKTLNNIYH